MTSTNVLNCFQVLFHELQSVSCFLILHFQLKDVILVSCSLETYSEQENDTALVHYFF